MTILEFMDYNEDKPLKSATLSWENQSWFDPFDANPGFMFKFSCISVTICPTQLVMTGGGCYLCFHNVKGIQIISENNKPTQMLVTCKAVLPDCSPAERTYKFIVET